MLSIRLSPSAIVVVLGIFSTFLEEIDPSTQNQIQFDWTRVLNGEWFIFGNNGRLFCFMYSDVLRLLI